MWNQIATHFANSSLLLGNGASIAVNNSFDYPSIFETAKQQRYLNASLIRIFKDLETYDFEYVLYELWHSSRINKALNLGGERKIIDAYNKVKNALIETVNFIHKNVTYDSVRERLKKASSFLSRFNKVFSLNYDLLVYWAIMLGLDDSPSAFKDGFGHGKFNWEWALNPGDSTMIFYPHGNLVIGRHIQGGESKICSSRTLRRNLLSTITDKWQTENYIPVFVSEGKKEQKEITIAQSPYLNIVNKYFLQNIGSAVVVYGWSMRDIDDHILDSVLKKKPIKFAISLYQDDPRCSETRERIIYKLTRNRFYRPEIYFFNAKSDGCWIY